MALEKGGMFVETYMVKFHDLSRYVIQLVTIKKERI